MPPPDRRSPLAIVVRSRFYRGAALSLFFSGLGLSAALPQLSLFLVRELGASLEIAGLFFLTNLSAPVFGLLVGMWSERLGDRLTLFRAGAIAGTAGYLVMAWTGQIWVVFAVNITVLGFAGATGGLIFAAVRDELNLTPTGMDNRIMSTVRLAFSFGFMTGPVFGSVFGGLYGLRFALLAAAVATGLQLVWLIGTRSSTGRDPTDGPAEAVPTAAVRRRHPTPKTGLAPLLIFLGLAVIAMSGDAVKFAYLPIYMADQLGSSDAMRGAIISLQSVGMVVFTPIAGSLADRYGAPRVVMVSVCFGVVANLGFTLGGHEAVLAAATVLNSMMWASLGGIGITVAQELHPTRIGLASSLYYSTLRFSGALGGIVGAAGVVRLGVPGVFILPAALCALAASGLIVQAILARRR